MIGLLCFVLAVLASPFKSKARLEAENAVLRHQLIVLRRRLHGRVRLSSHDRWFFIQLYRWFPSILKVLTIIRPETLVRWHRAAFRCYWRWKSRPLGGRPAASARQQDFPESFRRPNGFSRSEVRPERPERRLRLVSAIARGRRWLDELVSGSVASAEQIAQRERCSIRHVNMTISLAFLAPKLVRAAVAGRLPRGINIARLRDAPAEWSRQFEALGLDPQR